MLKPHAFSRLRPGAGFAWPGRGGQRLMGAHFGAGRAVSTVRQATWAAPVVVVTAAILVGLFLGLASAILPWWFLLAGLVIPLLVVLAFTVPEFAIIGLLMLLCGVIPANLVMGFDIGPGRVRVHEIALILIVLLALMKAFISPPRLHWPWRQIAPVAAMALLAFAAALVGWKVFGTPLKDVLNDARNHLTWVLLLPILLLVRTPAQVKRLQWGMVVLGVGVAVLALLQFATGWRLLQDARVEELSSGALGHMDVTRSIVGPGIYFTVFTVLFLLGRLMCGTLSWLWGLPLLSVAAAGLLVTFGRGVWFATFLAVLVLAYWLRRGSGILKVLAAMVAGITVAVAALALVNPNVGVAALDRLTSAGEETFDRNTTLGWRLDESTFALRHIADSPLLGIGLGTAYKPLVRMNGVTITPSDIALTRYIHNAYIGIWLKLGLLGPIVLAVLVIGFWRRSQALARAATTERDRVLLVAMACAFLVPLITSVTQPEWLTQAGIAFFLTLYGLQLVIWMQRQDAPGASAGQAPAGWPARWQAAWRLQPVQGPGGRS